MKKFWLLLFLVLPLGCAPADEGTGGEGAGTEEVDVVIPEEGDTDETSALDTSSDSLAQVTVEVPGMT